MNIKKHNQKGFISLFAVLIATVVMSMAIGMSSIALKQMVLSSNAEVANQSFFSADSALQCAMYHDRQNTHVVGGPGFVDCGVEIQVSGGDGGVFIYGNPFSENFEWQYGTCAKVTVFKGDGMTEIEAFGYNVSCEDLDGPRVVERALRVRYAS